LGNRIIKRALLFLRVFAGEEKATELPGKKASRRLRRSGMCWEKARFKAMAIAM